MADWFDQNAPDPLNVKLQRPEDLPSQEHFDQSHKSFMDRARATFQGATGGPKPAAGDWFSANAPQDTPATAETTAEAPGGFSRFFGSVVDQLNPIPAIREFINRPEEFGKASDAFHVLSSIHKRAAEMPENKGKPVNQWKEPDLTPAERIAVEKGMNANLPGAEGQHPLMQPAVTATGQAMRGDLAGAAGTIAGGYVAPAVAGDVAPRVASGVAKATEKAGGATGRYFMKSALKPGVADAATLGDVREQVNTALENKIPVTEKGASKLQTLIANYGDATRRVIEQRTRQGAAVEPEAVASRLDQIDTSRPLPEKDIATVANAKQSFLERNGAKPAQPPSSTGVLDASGQPIMRPGAPATAGKPIPLDVAQAEKQGAYRRIDYGKMSEAQIEAEKALARGYREEMEAQAPELSFLNKKEGEFLGLQKSLERAVRRAGNQDVVDFKGAAGTLGGAAAAGPIGAAVGFTSRALDFPMIKSKLAISINVASRKAGTPLGMAASNAKATAILSRIAASSQSEPNAQAATEQPQQ